LNKNIIGKKYNRLTILEVTDKRGGNQEKLYKCRCDCGNYHYTTSARLKNNTVKSCGCLNIETSKRSGIRARKKNEKYYKEGTFIKALGFKKPKSNNKSGYTGVSWNAKDRKWEANLTLKGKRYYLGQFAEKEEAIEARKAGEEKYFKPVIEKYK